MKSVTPENYKEDPLYRRVVNAVRHLQQTKAQVTPINVLQTLGSLSPDQLQQWRQGYILFLEAVLQSNLSKTNRVLRLLALHARDLELRPASIRYVCLPPGRRRELRFTRSGTPAIERAYATEYRSTAPPRPASVAGGA